jgi:hypothetical protein
MNPASEFRNPTRSCASNAHEMHMQGAMDALIVRWGQPQGSCSGGAFAGMSE